MLTIDNKTIEEKIKQLRKAIEIVGGKSLLDNIKSNEDLANYILNGTFQGEKVTFKIIDIEYTVNELFKLKLDYEKNYIKNKKIYIEKISY
ncbi:hypothetical protein R0131_10960, partial [Clostridium sp. AL.422]|uniref:hypothetical protein n=1 Tax=Clostridium TaxID=1485 RepID=UPI00293DCAB8